MHTGLKIAALLLLLATAGCRSQGELDLAERDLRLQENRIYKLQDYVHQYQMMLEECEAENEQLRKQLAEQGRTPNTRTNKPRTLLDALGSGTSRKDREPGPSGPDLNLPITPSIDLGTEVDPTQITPPAPATTPMRNQKPPAEEPMDQEDGSAAPTFTPGAPAELPEPDELPAPGGAAVGGGEATQIAIRAIGHVGELNNIAGERGLLVMVEPRTATGRRAQAPQGATMSLMLVTDESEQVLGRWDYSEDDTAAAYRDETGNWRFVLPFMANPGTPTKLKVYVRMVNPDGSKLLTDKVFDTSTGASFEELPPGNARWSRSRRPLAAISDFIGRELRTASQGFVPAGQGRTSRGGNSNSRGGGNQAPAWQLQEMRPPSISVGSTSPQQGSPSAGNAGNVARAWDPERASRPLEAQPANDGTTTGPAASTASESGRPTWSPYR